MSYLAIGGGGNNPTTGAAVLAVTGVSGVATQMIWLAVVLIIIGGTIMTLLRFAPRMAIDVIPMPNSSYRPWLTINGRPVGKRFRDRT